MGQPVVHFEVIGSDAGRLRDYYSELFGWKMDADNPMSYGIVAKEDNETRNGGGIGGGIGQAPEGHRGHVTFYVAVPDVEAALARAESLGGARRKGPETIMEGVTLGHLTDPEGNLIGLIEDPEQSDPGAPAKPA